MSEVKDKSNDKEDNETFAERLIRETLEQRAAAEIAAAVMNNNNSTTETEVPRTPLAIAASIVDANPDVIGKKSKSILENIITAANKSAAEQDYIIDDTTARTRLIRTGADVECTFRFIFIYRPTKGPNGQMQEWTIAYRVNIRERIAIYRVESSYGMEEDGRSRDRVSIAAARKELQLLIRAVELGKLGEAYARVNDKKLGVGVAFTLLEEILRNRELEKYDRRSAYDKRRGKGRRIPKGERGNRDSTPTISEMFASIERAKSIKKVDRSEDFKTSMEKEEDHESGLSLRKQELIRLTKLSLEQKQKLPLTAQDVQNEVDSLSKMLTGAYTEVKKSQTVETEAETPETDTNTSESVVDNPPTAKDS